MLSAAKAEVAAKLATATAPAEKECAARESNYVALQVGRSRSTGLLPRNKNCASGEVEWITPLPSLKHGGGLLGAIVWACRPHEVAPDVACPMLPCWYPPLLSSITFLCPYLLLIRPSPWLLKG